MFIKNIGQKLGRVFFWVAIVCTFSVILVSNLEDFWKDSQEKVASMGGGPQKSFLDISGSMIFWTLITFFVLVAVLSRYAWHPIIEALDSRTEKMESDIAQAEKLKQESEQLLKQRNNALSTAQQEARNIIDNAQKTTEKQAQSMFNEAQKQASDIISKANQQAIDSKNQALNEAKDEIATLSLWVAEKIISKSLSVSEHKKLIDESIYVYESRKAK